MPDRKKTWTAEDMGILYAEYAGRRNGLERVRNSILEYVRSHAEMDAQSVPNEDSIAEIYQQYRTKPVTSNHLQTDQQDKTYSEILEYASALKDRGSSDQALAMSDAKSFFSSLFDNVKSMFSGHSSLQYAAVSFVLVAAISAVLLVQSPEVDSDYSASQVAKFNASLGEIGYQSFELDKALVFDSVHSFGFSNSDTLEKNAYRLGRYFQSYILAKPDDRAEIVNSLYQTLRKINPDYQSEIELSDVAVEDVWKVITSMLDKDLQKYYQLGVWVMIQRSIFDASLENNRNYRQQLISDLQMFITEFSADSEMSTINQRLKFIMDNISSDDPETVISVGEAIVTVDELMLLP